MVKGRKSSNTKAPSPHRRNWMLRALGHRQNITLRGSTKLKLSLLPFEELNRGIDHLSTNSEYDTRSRINFPLRHAPNQVDSNTNLLDKVILTKVVLRPTKKSRNVGPHKSILKKNGNKRKSDLENKKFRSVCKPTYGTTADCNVNNIVKSLRHLVYKSKDRNTYPHRNTSTLFPIIWKFTKNQLRIIPDHLPHHELNHMIELKTDSSSMLDKDK